MSSARTSDRLRNVALGLLCSAISISLIVGLYIPRFVWFVHSLDGYAEMNSPDYRPPVFPKLTDRELVNLGWAHSVSNHPDSSYINFSERKPPGVVRIGTFGDSNTAGSEVAPNHDYATFLQRRFAAAGYANVEVINFGVGSYGVHQSYLMWKTLGEKFDLDVAILMPFDFHIKRDDTFIKGDDSFAAIHARYVLADGDVALIEVLGESRLEASERYFSIFPAERYLHYDRRPPPFLRALVPRRRELKFNPFYYDPGMGRREEIKITYVALIERWTEEVPSLVVTTPSGEFFDDLSARLASSDVEMLKSRIDKARGSTLYRAPITHWSALGHDLRSEELFSYLTGAANPQPRVLRVRAAERPRRGPVRTLAPLSRYARISVDVADFPAAEFVQERRKGNPKVLGRKLDPAESEIVSLLQVPASRIPFLPLPFALVDGAAVRVAFELDGERVEARIGSVEAGSDVVGRIRLDAADPDGSLAREGKGWRVSIRRGDCIDGLFIAASERIGRPEILVGERAVLKGRRRGADRPPDERGARFESRPVGDDFAYLRARAGQFVDVAALANETGPLELVLEDAAGTRIRQPLPLDYAVVSGDDRPFAAPYPRPITPSGVRAAP